MEDHASVVELTRRLVQVPSRSGLDHCRPVLQILADWLRDHALRPRLLERGTDGPLALVCDLPGGHPGPRYVLDACVDTAPFGDESAWTHAPTSGAVVDGWLHGRGSSDSKAAAAVFCHLAARLEPSSLHGSVTLLFDADEHTGAFGGAKRYFEQETTPAETAGVMIGYPGLSRVVVGGRGFVRAAITVRGTAGHSGSSAPDDGNAVHKAAILAQKLARVPLPAATEDFPLPPKLTLTAVHGGEADGGYTIVPDRCVLHVDVRLTPAFDARAACALLERTVRDADAAWPMPWPTDIALTESWPAYRLGPDSRVRAALLHAAERATGRPIPPRLAGPSNIGNYLAALGIEATAGFGVAYRNLHGTDECIDTATIPMVQAAYHEAVLTLLSALDGSDAAE